MTAAPKPGFLLVAKRECQWLLRDRVALILILGVPLFAFVVLTIVFSHPVIRGLGVSVVDEDRSDASRALVEYVAASPSLHIVDRSGDLSTAARDIRSGKAIAAVYIPANFERDLKAERRPQVVGFYNQQFLTAAGIASSGLSDTLSAAAAIAAPGYRAAPAAASIGSRLAPNFVGETRGPGSKAPVAIRSSRSWASLRLYLSSFSSSCWRSRLFWREFCKFPSGAMCR
jgi:ABC-2 type transport system permease protein